MTREEGGYGQADYGEDRTGPIGRRVPPAPAASMRGAGPAGGAGAGGAKRAAAPGAAPRAASRGSHAGARRGGPNWRLISVLGVVAVVVAAVVVATQGGGGNARADAGQGVATTSRSKGQTTTRGGRAGGAAKGTPKGSGGTGANGRTGRSSGTGGRAPSTGGIPAVEAGVVDWQLQAPISREAVLPGAAGSVLLAGGLAGGASQSAVFTLSLTNGALQAVGQLPAAAHDVAAAQLGSRGFVFGGGAATPASYSQVVTGSGAGASAGTLPAARADAAAVAIGGTAYIVGGYDGSQMDAAVLATTDGASFTTVAQLPVPVRYPAVAALGTKIYVFGGQDANGAPTDSVQVVDPATHQATVVGHLPVALSAATAATIGGYIYLAGGDTPLPQATTGAAQASGAIYAYDPATGRFLVAGSLRVPVANAGATVTGGRLWLVGGETAPGSATADVQVLTPNRHFGIAGQPGAGSPYYGDKLLIADRGNDRLLLLDDTGKILWTYPNAKAPPPPGGFYFPDDAFFIRHGTAIISNQEENETLVEIGYPSGKVLWQYGHPRVAGAAPGYLNNPDDAYLLQNGHIVVADPKNCRVLIINPATKQVLTQVGTNGVCMHNPPTYLGSPNGDTPLANGDLLVSEINGSWIDEMTQQGKLVWTTHIPIGYPSDPQTAGPGRYLVADYENPGSFLFFDQSGQVLYKFGAASGPGYLNQPSLAELLPSGVVMLNDDYNDRMVAVDPATSSVVWQYGQSGVPGTAPGYLNTPDGFDVLAPGGGFPTHPITG
ncbi:MAG TPA: hypothetical protein VFN61_04660 [Acidimicrobiales bacterium]|nr:hypothetical protein [Acidimicrobiales bacterium]